MAKGLATLTPERRAEVIALAQAARRANVAARRASPLRKDFAEDSLWDELARKRKLRLPPYGKPPTVSTMRTFIHKAGMTEVECKAWLGCPLAKFAELNSLWPLRAFAGLVLEYQEEHK